MFTSSASLWEDYIDLKTPWPAHTDGLAFSASCKAHWTAEIWKTYHQDESINEGLDLDRDALAAFCRKSRVRELSLFASALRCGTAA